MAVVGICMARDEQDIIGATVGQMCSQVDAVWVYDNGSVDDTAAIARAAGATVYPDDEPGHYQSRKMTERARRAADEGFDWVCAFDADEFWYSSHGRIADVLADVRNPVAPVAILDHRACVTDPDDPNPITRMGWRLSHPLELHKIACRPALRATITEGNHSANYDWLGPAWGLLELRHYPMRSVDQFERKVRNGAAALAATDLPERVGAHWRGYGRAYEERGRAALEEIFNAHFLITDPATHHEPVVHDPAP